MDFAKRMLEKYGWSEGQGLGKDSTGITSALKPKVKLNNFGLGHDRGKEFTYRWWEDAFNEAARNVNVEESEDGPKMKTVDEDALEISAIKRSKINRDKAKYGTFVKRATLTPEGVQSAPVLDTKPPKLPVMLPATLSDEQLFQACGGLTAHKGARHGLTLSGKLKRVKEQEEALLKAFQQNQTKSKNTPGKELREESEVTENNHSEKSKSKEKKSKSQNGCEELAETCVNGTQKKKEKKKKKSKLECEYLDESKLSDKVECENQKSKKRKKKHRLEITESNIEDTAESVVDHGEEDSVRIKRRKKKDKTRYKEEEECQQDESNASSGKKAKKKRKFADTEG